MKTNLKSNFKRILSRGLLALAITAAAYSGSHGKQATSRDLAEKVADLAPAGWQIFGAVKQFGKENVWEQINGRASFFLAYDMVRMTYVSFVNSANDSQFLELSIYDMGNPTNAFGAFSAERSPETPSVELGRAGNRSDANYFIWKGRYYIRIISSEATDAFQRIGLALARRVTHTLTDSGEPVWGLTGLPLVDRIPQSVRYFKVNAMGLEFMRNTYTAEYRKGNSVVTAFLSAHSTVKSAQDTVARYAGYAKKFGEGTDQVAAGSVELAICNMGGSYDVVFYKGQLMSGVSSVEDRDLAVRSAVELWKQLPMDK